ncbi:pentatricopeptide repeat-containing protein At2g03880, mitochondrial [Cryptomeria japonica]|uniref:pentatricopeptide repeat-containing protein At2g03880, mitochondrial n=1 Tax=Cryptomeria japonica TaxID=3369 RepID=UPI0027D9ECE6|nr:pentatricopeptide repeat-containing protein At2g03880, mitochondrial [Cryptomeria japonica]
MVFPLWNPKPEKIYYLRGLLLHHCPRLATTAAFQKQSNICNIYPENVRSLCEEGRLNEALRILCDFDHALDCSTYVSLLQGCINNRALPQGKLVHAHIIQMGFGADKFLFNRLVGFYVKCVSLEDARKVFDKMPERDYFSWNAMIAAYTRQGIAREALELFHLMPGEGIQPNQFTFSSILPACSDLASLERIHEKIIKSGIELDMVVESALVDMYAKFGCIESARNLFDKMSHRDDVSWMVMIAGYVQNGWAEEALKLYQVMRLTGLKLNSNTFASILPACAYLGTLEQGIEIHEEIIRSGVESDVYVGSALVDMYAKCGSIKKAREVFDKMPRQDVVSWTAMIAGYAVHGCAEEALILFQEMKDSGVRPNHVTLLCVLSACCHAGLVDEGYKHFNNMRGYYRITPRMEHYRCMVDLLGRAGQLEEAQDFINRMPIEPDAAIWRCLLAACRYHNNIDLGEHVAAQALKLDSQYDTPYVLLSNMYAEAGRWDDLEKVRKLMKDRGIKKTPGRSWIELNKHVHVFYGGDRSHPQTEQIYAKLETLAKQMRAAGHVPHRQFALADVEEEQKEQILCHHSEKLAIAFGLLNTPPGTTILVIKNLRVCGDCHSAIKFTSDISAREIILRDTNRYHHFKNGQCSCGDYW